MTFTLDTSGAVYDRSPYHSGDRTETRWHHLTPFAQGYIAALFEAEQDPHPLEAGTLGRQIPGNYGFRNLAPEALALILADCARAVSDIRLSAEDDDSGREFWLNRQSGHYLTFPPQRVYLDNAGKVQIEPSA